MRVRLATPRLGGLAAAALAVLVISAILTLSWTRSGSRGADKPLIAAAADLQFALTEVAAAFEAQSGQGVTLTFGSTGNFTTQIRQGAPFEMFLAADERYVLDLAKEGLTRDEGSLYATGRIVIIAPHGSSLQPDGSLNGLKAALQAGTITRFAIANPEHAPYGVRAMEALQHADLWEAATPKLVLGENVAQAAQFATSGGAEGGIIAYSLALSDQVSALGSYDLIPEDWHQPLNQRMVLLRSAGPVAEEFYDFMGKPAARAIMKKYGFLLPGE